MAVEATGIQLLKQTPDPKGMAGVSPRLPEKQASSTASQRGEVEKTASQLVRQEQGPSLNNKEGSSLNNKELAEQVDVLNNMSWTVQHGLKFSIHEDLNRTIVKVMDVENEKVVRQFPAEEVITVAETIRAVMEQEQTEKAGILLREQA